MTFVWRHPKFYKPATICRRDKTTQKGKENENEKAASTKQQAIDETVPYNDIEEAQASSNKRSETEQDGN